VQSHAFTLKGVIVELVDRPPKIQQTSETEYEVLWIGDLGQSLKAIVSPEVASRLECPPPYYVAVIEPKKYGSIVQVFGNTLRYDGLNATPVIFWR